MIENTSSKKTAAQILAEMNQTRSAPNPTYTIGTLTVTLISDRDHDFTKSMVQFISNEDNAAELEGLIGDFMADDSERSKFSDWVSAARPTTELLASILRELIAATSGKASAGS